MKSEGIIIKSIEVVIPKDELGFGSKQFTILKLFAIQRYLHGIEEYKNIIENLKLHVTETSVISWKGQSDVVKATLTFPMIYVDDLSQSDYQKCVCTIFSLLGEVSEGITIYGKIHTTNGVYSTEYNELDSRDAMLINYKKFLEYDYHNLK